MVIKVPANVHRPLYLDLLESGEFKKKVDTLKYSLSNCKLCPHECNVNRMVGERGRCRTIDKPIVASYQRHFGEEKELTGFNGSGTIFFANCNLSCVFCQNYEISSFGRGKEVTSDILSDIMIRLQKQGCHNINLVSPSHIVPQILEGIYIAAQKGLNIPIVYNTNGYDSLSVLKILEGVIDIYMPDIKFADDSIGFKYTGVKNYFSVVSKTVREMYRQVGNLRTDSRNIAYKGLLIRHLIMPENLAGTDKIMKFIGETISKKAYVHIMNQYNPSFKAYEFREISRRINASEYKRAIMDARLAGLSNYKT